MDGILLTLEKNLEVRLASTIGEDMRIRIKSGPMRGIGRLAEHRNGTATVFL